MRMWGENIHRDVFGLMTTPHFWTSVGSRINISPAKFCPVSLGFPMTNCSLCWSKLVFEKVVECYVRIRPDPDVPRERWKGESGGQLSTVHTRTRAGGNEIKSRGDLRRPEPNRSFQAFRRNLREMRGETSNISSEVYSNKYTKYIY